MTEALIVCERPYLFTCFSSRRVKTQHIRTCDQPGREASAIKLQKLSKVSEIPLYYLGSLCHGGGAQFDSLIKSGDTDVFEGPPLFPV